jgi:hypothetical protein
MQGLRAFCGIWFDKLTILSRVEGLESYKGKYLEKTQLHRLTAKVGLINDGFESEPMIFAAWYEF